MIETISYVVLPSNYYCPLSCYEHYKHVLASPHREDETVDVRSEGISDAIRVLAGGAYHRSVSYA
jgi:hypothetical protein